MSVYSTVLQRHLAACYGGVVTVGAPADRMSPALDDLAMRFALFARTAQRDVLDIGCGDGIAAAAALMRGARLYAVDPDQSALRQLLARVPPIHARRMRVRVGSLPGIDFKFPRFAAVHASRVLHLLDPSGLQESLRKFFRWLYPGGKLFLGTLSSEGSYWNFAASEFAQRRLAGDPWPGYLPDVRGLRPEWDGTTVSVLLLDEPVLRRELEAAGFVLERVESYPLPWGTDQVCCAVVARCAM